MYIFTRLRICHFAEILHVISKRVVAVATPSPEAAQIASNSTQRQTIALTDDSADTGQTFTFERCCKMN